MLTNSKSISRTCGVFPTISALSVYLMIVDCVSSSANHTTGPVLASFAVTQTNPSIAPGATRQFTAMGTYSDESTRDLTNTATWSSSARGFVVLRAGEVFDAQAIGSHWRFQFKTQLGGN
jgi:hypothetical protein